MCVLLYLVQWTESMKHAELEFNALVCFNIHI